MAVRMMPLKYRKKLESFKFRFAMFLYTMMIPYVYLSLMGKGYRATNANLMNLFIHLKH